MRAPEINSVWQRCDGAVLRVVDTHKQTVYLKVLAGPRVPDKRCSASGKIVQHVRSDFCNELGNTYMRKIS